MLVVDTPGAVHRYRFEGYAPGILVVAGPDAGMVEFCIDGGAFRRQDLFTRCSSSLHIPWAYVLEAGLTPGPHERTLRASSYSNAGSLGHAVRIVHLLATDRCTPVSSVPSSAPGDREGTDVDVTRHGSSHKQGILDVIGLGIAVTLTA